MISPLDQAPRDPPSSRYPLETTIAEAAHLLETARATLQRPDASQMPRTRTLIEELDRRLQRLAQAKDRLEGLVARFASRQPHSASLRPDPFGRPFFHLLGSMAKVRDVLAALQPPPPQLIPSSSPPPAPRDPSASHIPMPTGPVIRGALQAMFAGGTPSRWTEDHYGRPQYRYEAKGGLISLFFEAPPQPLTTVAALWDAVRDLSVETADVFLILMSRIAQVQDPARDLAKVRLEEIAHYRAVRLRHGNAWKLHDAFKQEVLRLADFRLTMVWQDYKKGGTVTFGKERPDRLLDIVDVEYEKDGTTWTAFSYRCGQALAHFLSPGGLRWIGNYSRALLHLSPYHEAFTKKVGTYWVLNGAAAATHGQPPRATPRSILEFCAEDANAEKPNRTVDRFIDAHRRLQEIGLITALTALPELEPPTRLKGYFHQWLDTPITVPLSDDVYRIAQAPLVAALPSPRKRRVPRATHQPSLPLDIPQAPQAIQADPTAIRRFRIQNNIHQAELARTLGITRRSLSRYETGVRTPDQALAARILDLWLRKVEPQQAALSPVSRSHTHPGTI